MTIKWPHAQAKVEGLALKRRGCSLELFKISKSLKDAIWEWLKLDSIPKIPEMLAFCEEDPEVKIRN